MKSLEEGARDRASHPWPVGSRLAERGSADLVPLAALQPAARTSVLFHRPTHRERHARNARRALRSAFGVAWEAVIRDLLPGRGVGHVLPPLRADAGIGVERPKAHADRGRIAGAAAEDG